VRILTVLTYYYPHWTGLTAYARLLAEGLARRGHQVTVLTSRYWSTLPREETHNGVRIVRLKPWFRLSRGLVQVGQKGRLDPSRGSGDALRAIRSVCPVDGHLVDEASAQGLRVGHHTH